MNRPTPPDEDQPKTNDTFTRRCLLKLGQPRLFMLELLFVGLFLFVVIFFVRTQSVMLDNQSATLAKVTLLPTNSTPPSRGTIVSSSLSPKTEDGTTSARELGKTTIENYANSIQEQNSDSTRTDNQELGRGSTVDNSKTRQSLTTDKSEQHTQATWFSPTQNKFFPSMRTDARRPWLTIAIPSKPRLDRQRAGKQKDYISNTIDGFLAQLPSDPSHPLFNTIRLLIVDNSGPNTTHLHLENYRETLKNNSKSLYVNLLPGLTKNHSPFIYDRFVSLIYSYVNFVDNKHSAASQGKDRGSRNKPGAVVRQQTLDMSKTLSLAAERWNTFPAKYFLLMEDDFSPCPHAIETLWNATQKASIVNQVIQKIKMGSTQGIPSSTIDALRTHTYRLAKDAVKASKDWIALRTSFAMNGIVLDFNDVAHLSRYLTQHVERRPPDHLIVEWFAGETEQSYNETQGRIVFAYRHNLFRHEGFDSTVGHSWRRSLGPKCYDILSTKTLFSPEAFNLETCSHDDISPCIPKQDSKYFAMPNDTLLNLESLQFRTSEILKVMKEESRKASVVSKQKQHSRPQAPRPPTQQVTHTANRGKGR